jgi:hypothetical protein
MLIGLSYVDKLIPEFYMKPTEDTVLVQETRKT